MLSSLLNLCRFGVFWFRLSWEMFLLHPKKMCLLLLLAGISINVIRSIKKKSLIVLFKSFINLIIFLIIFQLLEL